MPSCSMQTKFKGSLKVGGTLIHIKELSVKVNTLQNEIAALKQ